MEEPTANSEESTSWFDRKENMRKLFIALLAGCSLLVLIDIIFWITGFDKHPYLRWEKWPGFYAVYGFVACVVLVFVSKYALRPLVMREGDYYAEKEGGNDA